MISKEQIKHIAELARISLGPEEEKKIQKDLSSIFEYIEKLKEVDTKNVEPSFQFMSESFNQEGFLLRKDEARDCENSKELIDLAPENEKGYIKVKAIFNHGDE